MKFEEAKKYYLQGYLIAREKWKNTHGWIYPGQDLESLYSTYNHGRLPNVMLTKCTVAAYISKESQEADDWVVSQYKEEVKII